MSAMRKMAVYLGLVDDGEEMEDLVEERAVTRPEPVARPLAAVPAAVASPASSVSLDRIITLHPRTYNDARQIGEIFREGVPVIMNLSDMDDADARRLVDFGAGLVFGLHGTIERVTAKVFLLSPATVSVIMDVKRGPVEPSFFNQS